MTVFQAAERLGVSDSLIYQWCYEGRLPHYRVGGQGRRGHIRIDPADLDAFKQSLRVGGPACPSASAPASSGSPASPFSVLDPKRLAKAWKD